MAELFVVFVILCLCSCRVQLGKEINRDYLSFEQTQAVKGFFIILVFIKHFNAYVTYVRYRDVLCGMSVDLLGQLIVVAFLFYSGYGVMESIRKKGKAYIRSIPQKRFLPTLFRFDCAVLLFAVVALCRKITITLKWFLLSLTGWDSLGNSNWYMFAILMLYLITYVSFTLFSDERKAVAACFVLVCAGIFVLSHWNIKQVYWYDTALCYVLGMAYSLYRGQIEKVVSSNRAVHLLLVVILGGAVIALTPYEYEALGSSIRTCLFAMFVVLVTMRVRLKSRVFQWCGKHLFPLYILQRIPMIVLSHFGLAEASIPLFLVSCLAITLLMTIPFELATDWLWKKLVPNQ